LSGLANVAFGLGQPCANGPDQAPPQRRSLFGNDAAEDENEDVFKSYVVDRPEVDVFADRALQLAFARAYKGEGKSAILRIARLRVEEKLDAESLMVARPASELMPELGTEDYAAWTRAWKASIFELLANEIGQRVGFAWSDDAMTLVEQAEKSGFRARGLIGSIVDRLTGSVEAGPVKVALPQRKAPELSSVAGAVTRRAKNVPAVWVIVDDLDKNFENTRLQRTRVASFFDATRELARAVPELRIRAAIRPNVWTAIKMEFESLSHVEQYVHDLRWSEADARQLIARRIEGYLVRNALLDRVTKQLPKPTELRERSLVEMAFESQMQWGESLRPPHVLVYTLSKHRPRWIIELCKLASGRASQAKRDRIIRDDLVTDLAGFGDRRIQDTIAEFKSQCGQIEELISAFNRQPEQMTTAELLRVIDSKILEHVDVRISGVPGKPKAVQVAAFLFEIGFIFGRRDYSDGTYEHVTFSEKPSLLRSRASLDDGLSWEVHPVFRQSLEMRDASGRELRRQSRATPRKSGR
jgi:hypothetical protein